MHGNRCCPPTWRLREPLPQGLRPATWLRICLGSLLLALIAAAQPDPGQTQPQAPAASPPDLVEGVHGLLGPAAPAVDVPAMLEYYSRTSPDIHAEIRTRVASHAEGTGAYLERLADHYRRLDRVRQRNQAEFERLMALDLLESRARMLGRLILQLNGALTDGSTDDPAATGDAASRAKTELRDVLERAFDGTQQNQRIELNRLEAELRTMRRLLDEREAKRDLIIRQRFMELCGQELPAGPTKGPAKAANTPP